MLKLNGFKEWQGLFDENVSKVFCQERIPGLRNISMMMFSISREIKKIEKDLHSGVLFLRTCIEDNTIVTDSDVRHYPGQTLEAKNILFGSPKQLVKCSGALQNSRSNKTQLREPSFEKNRSIIISDEDMPNHHINNSPEIKKKHRHNDTKKKLRKKRILTECASFEDSLSNSNCGKKLHKCSFKTNAAKAAQLNNLGISSPSATSIAIERYGSDSDVSVVQSTPILKTDVSERKDKMPINMRRRRRKDKTPTFTKMFFKKDHEDNIEANCVSGITHENDSAMDITKMVSFLNTEFNLRNSDRLSISNSDGFTMSERSEILKEDDVSLNNAILEEDLNTTKEQDQAKGLNSFLAKMQNVPDQLEDEPVVRGKARKQLPGWSCKECEKFYIKQALNPGQILELNKKCSKHRSYSKPAEDTLPGFWTMDISGQDTENIE